MIGWLTWEMAIIGAVRVLGALPVLRWPLPGALIAVAVDLSDLFLMNLIDLGGLGDYQRFDKIMDQLYLLTFLLAALRWSGPPRTVAVWLYVIRLAGFVLFAATDARAVLLLFPNVFEFWFIAVAALKQWRPRFVYSAGHVAALLLALLMLKETQEYVIHGARLLDSFTAVEAVQAIWRWLTAPFS